MSWRKLLCIYKLEIILGFLLVFLKKSLMTVRVGKLMALSNLKTISCSHCYEYITLRPLDNRKHGKCLVSWNSQIHKIRRGSFSRKAGTTPYPPQPSLTWMWSVPPYHSRKGYPSVAPPKKLWTSSSFLYTDSALKNHTSLLKLFIIIFYYLLSTPPKKTTQTGTLKSKRI